METTAELQPVEYASSAALRAIPSDLCDRLLASERSALADLYDLYARRIYGLALWWSGSRHDAEDIVQDTFVRVWEKRHLVARSNHLEAYILRMAKTIAAGRHRKRRPQESLDECMLLEVDLDPERQLDASRLSCHLHALSPKLRAVVYLHSFCDLSFREVGAILRIPLFTAASRYRLAIERLKKMMESADV